MKTLYKVLSYIGPLFLISFFVKERNNKGVRIHCGQGMILFVLDLLLAAVCWLLKIVPYIGGWVAGIIGTVGGIIILLLMIVGIFNALTGRDKKLPFIGDFAIYK